MFTGYQERFIFTIPHSVQNITTLKAHKDEIRALYMVNDNILASAGRGSSSSGALLLWDLRNPSWSAYKK